MFNLRQVSLTPPTEAQIHRGSSVEGQMRADVTPRITSRCGWSLRRQPEWPGRVPLESDLVPPETPSAVTFSRGRRVTFVVVWDIFLARPW